MSNRFYVNGFQPFSNNCLGKKTYQELCRQGIKWIEDGWVCKKQKIKDPLALLEAIYEDCMADLVDRLKMKRKEEKKNVDEPLTDIELYGDAYNMVSHCIFNKDGSLKKFGWFYAGEIMGDKIVFATYFTYLAMLRSCKMEYDNEGFPTLTIKKNRAVWVEML